VIEQTVEEKPDRITEIRQAIEQGFVGHLIAQRDFWQQATTDLLKLHDENLGFTEQWRERADNARELSEDAHGNLNALKSQLSVISEGHRQVMTWLKGWIDKHPNDPGSARIAVAYELLEQGLADLPGLIDPQV